MKPSKREAIEKLIANLEGTCQNLDQVAPDYDLDPIDQEVADAIGQAVFECECCGWWFGRSDESGKNPGCCVPCSDGTDEGD